MRYRLIKVEDEYYLLGHEMAKEIGQFFAERHLTGEWAIYEVHSEHDTIHDGSIIMAATYPLPNTNLLDRVLVEKMISGPKAFTQEDIRSAMMHMKRYMEFPKEIWPEDPLVVISNYEAQLKGEWMCEIELRETSHVISGGLIPSGQIGDKGLQIHRSYGPLIKDNMITIKSAK